MNPIRLFVCLALIGCTTFFPVTARARDTELPKGVVRSGDGKVRPADGYSWLTTTDGDLRVRWNAGVSHPRLPNLIAAAKEGIWQPAAGYRWLNDTPGDLRVVRAVAMPSEDAMKQAVAKILGAAVAGAAGKPQAGDNEFTRVLRELAKVGRDNLIESAVKDLFPTLSTSDVQGVRRLISLGMDGKLTERNWRSATAKDELANQLRRINPDMAATAEVAEFISRVFGGR